MTTITKKTDRYLKALATMAAPVVVTAGLMAATAMPAHAASTFTVNNTQDPGDGICNASCTLSDAILAANDNPGADIIQFNIPDSGIKTIKPQTELPAITEAVTIDGYSQPGASPNTLAKGTNANLLVQLDGSDLINDDEDGLVVEASGSVVKGLVINRFPDAGLRLPGADSRAEGNFIGTDPSGTVDLGNGDDGVEFGANITIGGGSLAARNLISGNGGDGVFGGDEGSKVQNNLIGTKKDGSSPLGNSDSGVDLSLSDGTLVGGTSAGVANTIAFNGSDGVEVRSVSVSTGNSVLRNSIFSNSNLGIDLNQDGPTANDAGDADSGPNGLQNKPAVGSAKTSATATTVKGSLSSKPNQTYVIRFFKNPAGENEGKIFIGQKGVTTASDGKATFTFVPAAKVGLGQTVTATATDSLGSTSEFSGARTVVAQ